MALEGGAREQLLQRVLAYAVDAGISGKSLREIALGAGSSHRMLLYHFGSREGLLAAIVTAMEARQRAVLAELTEQAQEPEEVMLGLWQEVSSPQLRPFVRLFFEVFGMVVRGAPGTEDLRETMTAPWLADAAAAAEVLGVPADPAQLRLGVAVTRGLLLDLVAGADATEVDASYRRFVELYLRTGP